MAFHVLLKQILDGLHNFWRIARLICAIRLQEIRKCSSNWLQVCISGCHRVCQIGNAGRCGSFSHKKESHQCGDMRNLHCSGECRWTEGPTSLPISAPLTKRRSWAAKRPHLKKHALDWTAYDSIVLLACELRNHKPYHLLANPTVIASYIVQNDNFASELLLSSFGSNWHVSFVRFLPSVMMSCWNNFWMSHKNHVRLTGLGGIESSSRMLLFLVHDLRNSWGSWPFFICQTTMWKMTGEWDTLYHHMLISHWHFATEVKNNKPPATKTSVQPFYMFNLSVVCLLGRHCANLPAKL